MSVRRSGEQRPLPSQRAALLRALAHRLASGGVRPSIWGRVAEITPTTVEVRGIAPFLEVGDLVTIEAAAGRAPAQVARVHPSSVTVVPFSRNLKPRLGDRVAVEGTFAIHPHASWKGRVIDPFARPADGGAPLQLGFERIPLDRQPPPAMQRRAIADAFVTGVTALDLFTPLCMGQRVGLFAGSGVGKSNLLAMLASAPAADTIVLAMVGERGREVREFLETSLASRRARTVSVVATSDESAMTKRLAPRTAMAVAEHFRDHGENVLLIVDSLTRFAHAERDFALAAGELPVARGYPPSVFRELAHLVERGGLGDGAGSITLIASVLVDGDDHNDPVSDALRGLLDGHVVLDRAIAAEGRFPAVSILDSVSRLAGTAAPAEQIEGARRLRQLVSRFEDTRDLRAINGHRPGHDTTLDAAVSIVPRLYELLRQGPGGRREAQIAAVLALLPPARPTANITPPDAGKRT